MKEVDCVRSCTRIWGCLLTWYRNSCFVCLSLSMWLMREQRKGKGNQNSERFASSSCFVFENEMIISTRLNGCISHSEQWKFKIQNFDFFSYFTFFSPASKCSVRFMFCGFRLLGLWVTVRMFNLIFGCFVISLIVVHVLYMHFKNLT